MSLSHHEQECLMRLCFERYFSHHLLPNHFSLVQHMCLWRDKHIVILGTLILKMTKSTTGILSDSNYCFCFKSISGTRFSIIS